MRMCFASLLATLVFGASAVAVAMEDAGTGNLEVAKSQMINNKYTITDEEFKALRQALDLRIKLISDCGKKSMYVDKQGKCIAQ